MVISGRLECRSIGRLERLDDFARSQPRPAAHAGFDADRSLAAVPSGPGSQPTVAAATMQAERRRVTANGANELARRSVRLMVASDFDEMGAVSAANAAVDTGDPG